MSTPRPDKSALPNPSYHWTTWKARVFLSDLAHLGRVSEAARLLGMSRQSAHRLRERLGEDGSFASAWDQAEAEGRARRRARRALMREVTALPPESDIFGLGKRRRGGSKAAVGRRKRRLCGRKRRNWPRK